MHSLGDKFPSMTTVFIAKVKQTTEQCRTMVVYLLNVIAVHYAKGQVLLSYFIGSGLHDATFYALKFSFQYSYISDVT